MYGLLRVEKCRWYKDTLQLNGSQGWRWDWKKEKEVGESVVDRIHLPSKHLFNDTLNHRILLVLFLFLEKFLRDWKIKAMFLNTLKSLIDNNFYIYPPTPFLGFIINPLLNIVILFIYFSAVCLTCNAKWHYNEERHFQLEFLNRFMTITSAWTVKHNTQRDVRTQTHKAKMQQREWGGGNLYKNQVWGQEDKLYKSPKLYCTKKESW